MDSWERFNETSLPDKKAFYSESYLEHITDKDYTHARTVFEEFNLKNLGDYHDTFKVIHYYLPMYLKISEISVLKYINLILVIFCPLQD